MINTTPGPHPVPEPDDDLVAAFWDHCSRAELRFQRCADCGAEHFQAHSCRNRHCPSCQRVGADLAATVMLEGLLEALFLARINRLTSLAPVFTAAAAPKDKAGKPRPLKEWGLKDYLDVGKELGWIRQSAKDVGQVLRDYRNYIHPEKELSHGITVVAEDTAMFVSVFSSIAEQIIKSA